MFTFSKKRNFKALVCLVCLALIACTKSVTNEINQSGLVIKDAYINYRSNEQQHFAAYFNIENQTLNTIEIIDVASPAFNNVMIHNTVIENGIAKMRHIDKLSINSKENLAFKPEGKHIMLSQPLMNLSEMSGIYLVFILANGEKLKYPINFRKHNQ